MLEEGKVFKNFKELCVFMSWIDKDKTLSTCSKKKLEKDLNQICNWERIEGSNKIIITEIYEERKKRSDGRSLKSKYIKLIEAILLYELMNNKKDYLSINNIGEIIGIYNKKFKENSKFYSMLAFENYIDEYLVHICLFNIKGEVNRIIKRAMKSLITNSVIDAKYGIVIYSTEDGYRMADEKESTIISTIENETLNLLGCRNKGFLNMKKLSGKFKKIVKESLEDMGYEYIEFYYNGYFIKNFNNKLYTKTTNTSIDNLKSELSKLIISRLNELGMRLNKNAVRKEYEKLTFGEPMLSDVISSSNFIGDWSWLVDYFIDN